MQNVNELKKIFQENVSLAQYTTFKIGGPARYFYIAKTAEEIKNAMKTARENNISVFILGNGSNVLISDDGINSLAIKMQNTKIILRQAQDDNLQDTENLRVKIICDSGVLLGKLVNESVKNGLTGMEWAIGIPGTVGGAIVGNAGAFGHSISESMEKIEVLDKEDLSIKWIKKAECGFSYRESIFKKNDRYVILSAELDLKKGSSEESKKLIKKYLAERQARHPGGFPNAGSFFKNVLIKDNEKAFDKIIRQYPEAEKFRKLGTIPAAWLIEKRDLKGMKIGGAMVSDKHANFIVNFNKATARDVVMLASIIKQKIRDSFGIQLQEEVRYVGF